MLLEELHCLVDNDQIIAHHDAHCLYQRLVEEKGPVASVEVHFGVALLHSRPLHPRGHGQQDPGLQALGPLDAEVYHGSLAGAGLARHGDNGTVLVCKAKQSLHLLLLGRVSNGQGLVNALVDVVRHPLLLRGESQAAVRFLEVRRHHTHSRPHPLLAF